MLNKDEVKILRTVKLAPIFIVILSLSTLLIVFKNNHNLYVNEIAKIRADSEHEINLLIKSEVLKVYDLVETEKRQSVNKIKADIKDKVYQAHTIASALYRNNKDKSEAEIKQLIIDALQDITFNKGRGYFFIYQNDGLSVMLPILPHLQNTNLWNFKDSKGNYLIQALSKLATTKGEGFLKWWWIKPTGMNTEYEKVGYVKEFVPFDWFIGTGDYVFDYEEELKKEILQRINRIRYGKNGHIFVVNFSGVYLNHSNDGYINTNQLNLTDNDGVLVTQQIIDTAKNGGGYLSHNIFDSSTGLASPKKTFIKGFQEWQWAIGSDAYMNEVEKVIASKKLTLNKQKQENLIQIFIIDSVILLTLFIISLIFSNVIRKQFLNYKIHVSRKTQQLSQLNQNLEERVTHRTQELAETNKNLESTLQRLTNTQEKLIASEKMASMVGLVSGVSHELNTPLGIIVTSISHIRGDVEQLFNKLKSQQLSRADLKRIEANYHIGIKLLGNNLEKSIQLIEDFKSLSTNSQHEQAQQISLKKLLQSLYESCQSALRKHNAQLEIKLSDDLTITSYQDTIINVLTQLIDNSLIHGFKGIDSPTISLQVNTSGDYIVINYFDNGVGIERKNSSKIFDLFYTTKRNARCTGLGLPIVYNNITQTLQGSIVLQKETNRGVSFIIHIASDVTMPHQFSSNDVRTNYHRNC